MMVLDYNDGAPLLQGMPITLDTVYYAPWVWKWLPQHAQERILAEQKKRHPAAGQPTRKSGKPQGR